MFTDKYVWSLKNLVHDTFGWLITISNELTTHPLKMGHTTPLNKSLYFIDVKTGRLILYHPLPCVAVHTNAR